MKKRNAHIPPPFDQLRRYVAGELSAAEQHAVERGALAHQEAADTLEGLEKIKQSNIDQEAVLSDLQARLRTRVGKRKRNLPVLWLSQPFRYASAAAVVLAVAWGGYWWSQTNSKEEQASAEISLQVPDVAIPPLPPQATTSAPEKQHNRATLPSVKTPPSSPVSTFEPAPPAAQIDPIDLAQAPAASAAEGMLDTVRVTAQQSTTQREAMPVVSKSLDAKSSQVFTVSGQVFSATDQAPMPGVLITKKGTNQGSTTDNGGNFKLPNIQKGDQIVASFVGYESSKITVKDSLLSPIQLQQDNAALQEVVVASRSKSAKATSRAATPVSGWKAYNDYLKGATRQFLSQNPTVLRGKVVIQFRVEATGELSDFDCLNNAPITLREGAISIIKTGPQWHPRSHKYQPEASKVRLIVRFE